MHCWDRNTVLLRWSQSLVMNSPAFMFDTFESGEMQRIPLTDTTHERGRERERDLFISLPSFQSQQHLHFHWEVVLSYFRPPPQCTYILCCRAAVCASSSALVVSLKTDFDIFMAFGVYAIVSSECVGCDSDELARTLLRTGPLHASLLPRQI